MTDVYSATTTINGKKTTYSYNELKELGNTLNLGETITNDNVKYNLYLYESDYNYRIADYLIGGIKNNVIEPILAEGINEESVGENKQINPSQELEVYVKYAILLNNQSFTPSKIHEVINYYDSNYELVTANVGEEGKEIAKMPEYGKRNIAGTIQIKGQLGYNISTETININGNNYNKVLLSGMGSEMVGSAEQLVLYLTFKVKKNETGFLKLGEKSNVAEIVSYSTYSTNNEGQNYQIAGIIDLDSAPGNCITKNNTLYYEDDIDSARGINITLPEEKNIRKITGQVWEDKKADGIKGKYDSGEELINDVIVQLIELKDVTFVDKTYQFEYIWQEMTTGKSNVYYLNYFNDAIESKAITLEEGEYKFEDMVPGNYIIRYIYGDGRYKDYTTGATEYDYAATDNIKKYNGYDYQSTIMAEDKYNKEYLDLSNRDQKSNEALDNESRRLNVMSYSTNIDNSIGNNLALNAEDALKETWMCSETPKINLSVEFNTEQKTGQQEPYGYDLKDVKFGIIERAETKIELDKQISGLRITGADGTIIVDTFNDINQKILKTDANRNYRNTWTLETDKELLQGATLEVQYTYKIINNSEEDYLSEDLINKFKSSSIAEYNLYLINKSDVLKLAIVKKEHTAINKGKYLSKFYYTGIVPTGEEKEKTQVGIVVPKIEEYINNKLLFNIATEVNSDFEKTNTEIKAAKIIKSTLLDLDNNKIKEELEGFVDTDYVKNIDFNTVLQNKEDTGFLTREKFETSEEILINDKEKEYKLLLTRVVSPSTTTEDMNYESYLTEILEYKLPTGRRDLASIPGNLAYRHSEDSRITLTEFNEADETWAQNIILRERTGEDKITPIQIVIITISSIALIGIGIVLIRKYVVKKI